MQLTNDVVFDDLWRRSDLSLRDRSLVTIAALAAMGDDDQLDGYLRRGVESGLTRAQITEALRTRDDSSSVGAGWRQRLERADRDALLVGQLDQQAAHVHLVPDVGVGSIGQRIDQVKRVRAERSRCFSR